MAVNTVQTFFDSVGFIYQPVDGGNDIGKDAYVDIVDGGAVTGELIAVQVKGGASYRRTSTTYAIPASEADIALWSSGSIPVIGIVVDPDDQSMHWTNLTDWARSGAADHGRTVIVGATLTADVLPRLVEDVRSSLRGESSLLDLAADDPVRQQAAIWDSLALGRRDARSLLLLRASLRYFSGETLRLGIHVLALAVGHGDTFYTSRNWIQSEVKERIRPQLSWSGWELERLIGATEPGEWDRGGLGQDVAALTMATSGWRAVMMQVATESADSQIALRTLIILVADAGANGLARFDEIVARNPVLRNEPVAFEVRAVLCEFGYLSLW